MHYNIMNLLSNMSHNISFGQIHNCNKAISHKGHKRHKNHNKPILIPLPEEDILMEFKVKGYQLHEQITDSNGDEFLSVTLPHCYKLTDNGKYGKLIYNKFFKIVEAYLHYEPYNVSINLIR